MLKLCGKGDSLEAASRCLHTLCCVIQSRHLSVRTVEETVLRLQKVTLAAAQSLIKSTLSRPACPAIAPRVNLPRPRLLVPKITEHLL